MPPARAPRSGSQSSSAQTQPAEIQHRIGTKELYQHAAFGQAQLASLTIFLSTNTDDPHRYQAFFVVSRRRSDS